MEHGLTGHACEAGNAFRDQILHALGYVCLLEEGFPLALDVNQLIELLDLIAEFDCQGVILYFTGIADGFHLGSPFRFLRKWEGRNFEFEVSMKPQQLAPQLNRGNSDVWGL